MSLELPQGQGIVLPDIAKKVDEKTPESYKYLVDNRRETLRTLNALVDNDMAINTFVAASLATALLDPGANGIVVRTALTVSTARSLDTGNTYLTISNSDGVASNPSIAVNIDSIASYVATYSTTQISTATNPTLFTQWVDTVGGIYYTAGNVAVGTAAMNLKLSVSGDMGLMAGNKLLMAGSTGGVYAVYNSSSSYLEYYVGGTKRMEM